MPLFRRKPPRLSLRMPRIDGSSWPDRRDVERRSFAALTLYQMGYREAFEPEAATIADRLVEEVLPMFPIDSAPGDAPYLRQVFVSAAQLGAGIGIVERRTTHPDERSIDLEVGRALWEAVSELPAMPPEQPSQFVSHAFTPGGAVSRPDEQRSPLPPPTPTEAKYLAVLASPEFQDLRRRYRRWVLPVTVASLLWYFAYVVLAAYATDFMSQRLVGNINVGLVLGLLQFVTTFAVTWAYVRYADRVLDPRSSRIREEMEAEGLL